MWKSLVTVWVLLVLSTVSLGQAPDSLGFQGFLTRTDGAPLDSNNVSMTFKLYKSGVEIWSETQLLDVNDGVYHVYLGAATPLDTVSFDRPIELGVTIDGDPPEMTPRTPLVSSAFARALPGIYTFYRDVAAGGGAESYNIVGGASNNGLGSDPNIVGATISGGGGFLGGVANPNTVTGWWGTIGGGLGNIAWRWGTVAGGDNNWAGGHAFVGGGKGSSASADASTIGGGFFNQASHYFDTIGGGENNYTIGPYATIAGGRLNNAFADTSTIGGGSLNTATGLSATIAGGGRNHASGEYGFVGGGSQNTANNTWATVGGGNQNTASGWISTLGGGLNNAASGQGATVGGGSENVASGFFNATVGGGWQNTASGHVSTVAGGTGNHASADFSTVGGGQTNTASGWISTLGGGFNNVASGQGATIGGGSDHVASGFFNATVGGGWANIASGHVSTVGGGTGNRATNSFATVPGGLENHARGEASFAAGVKARAVHNRSFVWSDGTVAGSGVDSLVTSGPSQFLAKATGGVWFFSNADTTSGVYLAAGSGAWAAVSDVSAKTDFDAVDPADVLERVAGLPLKTWRYKDERESVKHMGPTAQDFYSAFGLGVDSRHIVTVDADGVSLAAIQGLYGLVKTQQSLIENQQRELGELRRMLNDR